MTGFRVYVCKPGPNDGPDWRLLCKAPPGSGVKPLRRSSGTTDRAEAEAIAREKEATLNARPLPCLTPDPRVCDVLGWFLDVRSKDGTRTSTLVSYGTFARRLGDVLGDVRASALTRPIVLRARDELVARPLDAKTVNVTMGFARSAFAWASERELVAAAWPAIKLLPVKDTKKRPYDPAEVRAILDWLEGYRGGHYAPLVTLRLAMVDALPELERRPSVDAGEGPGERKRRGG